LADLLGEDAGLAEIHKLYRCHDRLLVHKQAVFDHLTGRWRDLFNISYDVLLYDLTSTYFEADPPFPEGDKRRYGYSRDHRPDCVQIVIAPRASDPALAIGSVETKIIIRKKTIAEHTSRMSDGAVSSGCRLTGSSACKCGGGRDWRHLFRFTMVNEV
jgi:hypothetical protein